MAVPARDWAKTLAHYRASDPVRSLFEILITVIPFVMLWALAYKLLSVSIWLTLLTAIPAAGFLVRLFLIQHDCGHGAFFAKKATNDWVGRVLGVFTLTPYDVWRRSHAIHHATHGNLDSRGIGDIDTLTVREYYARGTAGRLLYRLYRNPIVLFVIGPAYLFLLKNRLPFGFMRQGWVYWASALGTNVGIALIAGALMYTLGVKEFLLVHGPITLLASSIGVWLFYVQHQFEDGFWEEDARWNVHDAALYGSSHYDLPGVLRWFSANIGVHHVHHLYARIPYYRLPNVLRDHPELANVRRLTLWQSFACLRLRLWDESQKRLVTFAQARDLAAA